MCESYDKLPLKLQDSFLKKPKKPVVNRALLSQKQYINLLATPRPNPPPPKEPRPKKPPLKPPEMCSARLDQLAMPTRKLMESVLEGYHDKFEPERVITLAKRIHIVSTQRQVRTVPKRKIKKKPKKKSARERRFVERRLAQEWLRDQINTSSFLIMLFMKYKPVLAPNYKQLLIALRIMKLLRIKKGKNYPKYTKRYLLKICEQIAILIDSTCPATLQKLTDISAKEKEAEDKKHICWKVHSGLSIFGIEVLAEEEGLGEEEEELERLELLLEELEGEGITTDEDMLDEGSRFGKGGLGEIKEEDETEGAEGRGGRGGLEGEGLEGEGRGGRGGLEGEGFEGEGRGGRGGREGEDLEGEGRGGRGGLGGIEGLEGLEGEGRGGRGGREGEGLEGEGRGGEGRGGEGREGEGGLAFLLGEGEGILEDMFAVEVLDKDLGAELEGGHPPGTVCYLTWKIYCNWLTEFGDNIQKYGKCLKNFRAIFEHSEARQIELMKNILMNWGKYFTDCRQFEEKLTKYFRGKAITHCPRCLEDYSIDDLPEDHEIPKELVDAMKSTSVWKEMLNEAEEACKEIESKKIPPSPDEVSLVSVGTIEITEVSRSAQSSEGSFMVLEEIDDNYGKDDDNYQGPCGSCQRPHR